MDAFHVAEKSNKDLKAKLAEEEKQRKYIMAALNNVEKQAESQRFTSLQRRGSIGPLQGIDSRSKEKIEGG